MQIDFPIPEDLAGSTNNHVVKELKEALVLAGPRLKEDCLGE
jgi:hypothetical protein